MSAGLTHLPLESAGLLPSLVWAIDSGLAPLPNLRHLVIYTAPEI